MLRIAVVGDTGEGRIAWPTASPGYNARTPLDAIVITGDAFYPRPRSATDPQWDRVRALSQVGVPLFPVLGNHDFCGKSLPTRRSARRPFRTGSFRRGSTSSTRSSPSC